MIQPLGSGYEKQFYWKVMQKKVKKWVQQCHICQQNKPLLQLPVEIVQSLSIPDLLYC